MSTHQPPAMKTTDKLYTQLRESLNGIDDNMNVFPFDLSTYKKIKIDPFDSSSSTLSPDQLSAIRHNVDLCRDVILFFTSCGNRSGYGGHTGGAFDTVPEVVILDAFFRGRPDRFVPVFYDEAGHRVATQYLLACLEGFVSPEFLRFYRKGYAQLPGHPELGHTPGIKFSSGRLGHMWPMVNGIAMAHPKKCVIMLGSDGSQMEGNNAEAARLAVAKGLNVKCIIDDNDVTIAGKPSSYLSGFDIGKTLGGQGLAVDVLDDAEDLMALYAALRRMVGSDGPVAVIARRSMAPGLTGVEGTSHGHDAVPSKIAQPYLSARGHTEAVAYLNLATATKDPHPYRGVGPMNPMRAAVGATITSLLSAMDPTERNANIMVIDSDLGGSTKLDLVQKACPEVYVPSGVMERGNFSAAAGFGMHPSKQGVFSTFAAFLEMLCSEITMARLNKANVFSHFSHSGVDDMSDNTCHFGINTFFADNGLLFNDEDDEEADAAATKLYFPADVNQAAAVVRATFPLTKTNRGLRFVFTTRSKTPAILADDGTTELYSDANSYIFCSGVDEIVRDGPDGYIISFGDALYRSLDAVIALAENHDVHLGLINKCTLNIVDRSMMERVASSPMCLVVESLGYKTGLGSKFGTWLLETEHAQAGNAVCRFGAVATYREGCGGLWEQAYHQGFDSVSIQNKVLKMMKRTNGGHLSLPN